MKLTLYCIALLVLAGSSGAVPFGNFFKDMADKATEFMQGGAGSPIEVMQKMFQDGSAQVMMFAAQAKEVTDQNMNPKEWVEQMQALFEEHMGKGNEEIAKIKEKFEESMAQGMSEEMIKEKMQEMMASMQG